MDTNPACLQHLHPKNAEPTLEALLEERVRLLLDTDMNVENQLKLVTAGVNLVTAKTRIRPPPEPDSGSFFKGGNGNAAKGDTGSS